MNAMLLTDFYKTIHHLAYVENLDHLVSYWTPRMSRIDGVDKVVMFGLQGAIKKYLVDGFRDNFFSRSKDEVVKEYQRIIRFTMTEQAANTEFIEELHDLGYLPIRIKAIPEGTRVNIKTPMFEITNTVKGFGWLVNYIETLMSANVWLPITSATTAYRYREIVNEYFEKTVGSTSNIVVEPTKDGLKEEIIRGFIKLNDNRSTAVGDFSMRGMGSVESATVSGASHLTSFVGTATIPAIVWLEEYYNADCETEVVGKGTPSTEHSVMSSYGRDGEFECYRRLITEVFPEGNISIVSDTYDYWNVLTNYIPKLKDEILEREGKVIIRGDSGDPVDIICGGKVTTYDNKEAFMKDANIYWFYKNKKQVKVADKFYEAIEDNGKENCIWTYSNYSQMKNLVWVEVEATPENKGTVEILWEIFGGYINDKGYKVLNPHIGAIYGDSITPERARAIYERLEQKGFAATNCTLGAGSYSYQYCTRDTYGQALKATHSIIEGVERQIFKDPITDNGNFKKSQRGMCYVYREGDDILYKDGLTKHEVENHEEYKDNLLELVFKDGALLVGQSLSEIRNRLHGGKF